MSVESWPENLRQTLRRLRSPDRPPRLAVVGIGHELRGDDAAGMAVVRALRPLVQGAERLLAVEAGAAPENVCGLLRRFAPDLILLVDAARLGAEAGGVRWLDWRDTTAFSASTHSLPLHVLAGYLESELGCEVALLGIQPADLSFGAPLSPAVRQAVNRLAATVWDVFCGECQPLA